MAGDSRLPGWDPNGTTLWDQNENKYNTQQISLTNNALKEKTSEILQNNPKELVVSLKTKITETSLIEKLAKKSVIYNRR